MECLKRIILIEKTQTISNLIEDVEHYISNNIKYIQAMKDSDYTEALSCVTYLANKIP